ncbi:biotin/lipoyl-binding carrier protein [Rhizohabitans arisaemae]|uniref:biotin/lipoyl-binding carrier protein n=1 Tax=Rhizohabitans arisaemae TaxID=2720610 RepID=UPI0024B14B6A|nr:biotin/lipoyl-binding carrier protein [Rhizohabitans arisaemae]
MAEVHAEMVGSVLEVVVAEGDVVGGNDVLIILESMKMEIPVVTEEPGVVSKIEVAEGDVVQEGDLIAVIDHV